MRAIRHSLILLEANSCHCLSALLEPVRPASPRFRPSGASGSMRESALPIRGLVKSWPPILGLAYPWRASLAICVSPSWAWQRTSDSGWHQPLRCRPEPDNDEIEQPGRLSLAILPGPDAPQEAHQEQHVGGVQAGAQHLGRLARRLQFADGGGDRRVGLVDNV